MTRSVIRSLKALLAVAAALTAMLQLVVLPWLSGVVAADYPELAAARWPWLFAAVAGLVCVQVVLLALWHLLGLIERERIFSAEAFTWVDRIIAAFAAASAIVIALTGYHLLVLAVGPGSVALGLLVTATVGAALTLLMIVMRGLLRQAVAMRDELAAVV